MQRDFLSELKRLDAAVERLNFKRMRLYGKEVDYYVEWQTLQIVTMLLSKQSFR
jgi:hypothetical protein